MHGQNLNLFVLEQLPMIRRERFKYEFGAEPAERIVHDDVLHLTYTAYDMQPFARDQGYNGLPFPWDEEDRLHRRARLDAVFFHLYGIDRTDAEYILSTFPIVEREERQRYGTFRTRNLILAYMAALTAGNPYADVAG